MDTLQYSYTEGQRLPRKQQESEQSAESLRIVRFGCKIRVSLFGQFAEGSFDVSKGAGFGYTKELVRVARCKIAQS